MGRAAVDKPWKVYLVVCSDGAYYCGASNDVEARVAKHNTGRGAKYTSYRLPVRLLCTSEEMTKKEALHLEREVKKVRRDRKPDMVRKGHSLQKAVAT